MIYALKVHPRRKYKTVFLPAKISRPHFLFHQTDKRRKIAFQPAAKAVIIFYKQETMENTDFPGKPSESQQQATHTQDIKSRNSLKPVFRRTSFVPKSYHVRSMFALLGPNKERRWNEVDIRKICTNQESESNAVPTRHAVGRCFTDVQHDCMIRHRCFSDSLPRSARRKTLMPGMGKNY